MDGEIQHIDHHGHMDDAAPHPEDAGQEPHPHAGHDAQAPVIGEALRDFQQVLMLHMGGIPVHEQGHAAYEEPIVKIQHLHREAVHQPGAQESPGQSSQGKGNGRVEEDPLLPDIGQSPGHGICQHDEQGRARNLGRCGEIGIDAPL